VEPPEVLSNMKPGKRGGEISIVQRRKEAEKMLMNTVAK